MPQPAAHAGTSWSRARRGARRWADEFVAAERRFDLVAAMTLVLLLLFTASSWYMQVGVLSLSVAAVLYRPLARQAWFWFAITLILVVGLTDSWFYVDNHQFLITYWCFALGLARLAPSPEAFLAFNARVLVGLAFLFAVVWKLVSGDYLDGTFFEFHLIHHHRFAGLTELLGGIPASQLGQNVQSLQDLTRFGDPSAETAMHSSGRITLLANVLTWWTLGIEAFVAACFLWPVGRALSRWRDPALLAFLVTTYPVAPVVGFAWVLTAMGTAQSADERFRYWTVLYAGVFLLVLVSLYFPFSRVDEWIPFL